MMGPATQATVQGGSMLPGLIVMVGLAWCALQLRKSRAAIWRRRFSFVTPLLTHISKDCLAVYVDIKRLVLREHRQAAKLAKADEAFERFFNAG